ncbi:MAG: hypothetical protein HUJ28_00025 [Chromatiales bacterium]|nr:hypothetical protein [Chromatiales bacterium]
MNSNELSALLEEALRSVGEGRLVEELTRLSKSAVENEGTLTIIANAGVHHLPEKLLRGQVFNASEGTLNFTSQESTKKEFEMILKKLAVKLKERDWKRVYLIPFGPANLSMLLKLLVYRVTHIETIDMFYCNGEYMELDIQIRPLVVDAK